MRSFSPVFLTTFASAAWQYTDFKAQSTNNADVCNACAGITTNPTNPADVIECLKKVPSTCQYQLTAKASGDTSIVSDICPSAFGFSFKDIFVNLPSPSITSMTGGIDVTLDSQKDAAKCSFDTFSTDNEKQHCQTKGDGAKVETIEFTNKIGKVDLTKYTKSYVDLILASTSTAADCGTKIASATYKDGATATLSLKGTQNAQTTTSSTTTTTPGSDSATPLFGLSFVLCLLGSLYAA